MLEYTFNYTAAFGFPCSCKQPLPHNPVGKPNKLIDPPSWILMPSYFGRLSVLHLEWVDICSILPGNSVTQHSAMGSFSIMFEFINLDSVSLLGLLRLCCIWFCVLFSPCPSQCISECDPHSFNDTEKRPHLSVFLGFLFTFFPHIIYFPLFSPLWTKSSLRF